MSARGPAVGLHAYMILTPVSPVVPGSPRAVREETAFGVLGGGCMSLVQP